MGKRDEAIAALRQAAEFFSLLVLDKTADAQEHLVLADVYFAMGILYGDIGKRTEAMSAYQKALKIRERLVQENPMEKTHRIRLGNSHFNIAMLYRKGGKPLAALASCEQAAKIQDGIVREYPDVPSYQDRLASSLNSVGALLMETGQPAKAMISLRRTLALRERLASDNPTVDSYQTGYAGTCVNLAYLIGLKQKSESLELYRKALTALQKVLKGSAPSSSTARHFERNAHLGRALLLDNLARHGEAADDWRKVMEFETGQGQIRARLRLCPHSRVIGNTPRPPTWPINSRKSHHGPTSPTILLAFMHSP